MPLLADPEALRERSSGLAVGPSRKPDIVLGAEARGFIIGAALAFSSGAGSWRRGGRASSVADRHRALRGSSTAPNSLELHATRSSQGQRVLVHDDVLATGGPRAMADLVERLGKEVVRRGS